MIRMLGGHRMMNDDLIATSVYVQLYVHRIAYSGPWQILSCSMMCSVFEYVCGSGVVVYVTLIKGS